MMATLDNFFYHKTIQTYTSIIGTIFNNIKVQRTDGKVIKVPLLYAGEQKANNRLDENEDPDKIRYKSVYPRMSFSFDRLERDDERIKNKRHQLTNLHSSGSADRNDYAYQYNRIPFIFSYTVNVKTKHIDDMLQIIEQVAVTLEPGLQVVVKDNPDLDDESAVQINLNSMDFNNQYEGMYEESRELTATFGISLEGYLYTGTSTGSSIIKKITINYYDLEQPDILLDQTVITPENQDEFK